MKFEILLSGVTLPDDRHYLSLVATTAHRPDNHLLICGTLRDDHLPHFDSVDYSQKSSEGFHYD